MDSDNEKNSSDVQIEDAKFQDAKFKPRRTPAEQKEALDAALAIDPGVATWSARAFHVCFPSLSFQFLTQLLVDVPCYPCCAGDSGFDGTTYFGLSGSDAKTGGAIPASWVPDRFGRRWGMFMGNGLLMIGAIITAMADSKSKFLGGRFLTGFGSSIGGASAKSYLAEITPPQTRGAYLGFLNSFYYVGQMTATGMMVSTGNFSSEWSWRLPLFVQVVPAALNFLIRLLLPRVKEQATEILARFHSSNGDSNSPLVALELEEIEEKISLEGADKHWWDFRPLFRTRADRWRTFMVIIIALFGSFMVDRTGRRKNLLVGTGSLVVILAIISGLLSETGSAARANAGITFIYLFMVVFSFGWTAMQALYPAEVLSYEARTKGLAFLGICSQSAQLVTTFGMPSAIAALTWKIYLVYMAWDIFEWIIIYFFVVETKGLTLEEITEVFEQDNPRKYSTQKLGKR
ncbi:general substrate transporter [Mycena olivaceomarginata]|nr:general substrate transporter [Mycena olivaceomarginata]